MFYGATKGKKNARMCHIRPNNRVLYFLFSWQAYAIHNRVIKSISYCTCASAPTILHTVPIFFIKLWHFKQQEPALRAHTAWNVLQQPLSAALSVMAYLWLWNAMIIIWGSAVKKGAVKRWWPLTAEWPLRTESCFLNILTWAWR